MTAVPRRVNVNQTAYAAPAKRKYRAKLTEAEQSRGLAMLEKGLSYGEAARKLGCTDGALRRRFPGYNRPKNAW